MGLLDDFSDAYRRGQFNGLLGNVNEIKRNTKGLLNNPIGVLSNTLRKAIGADTSEALVARKLLGVDAVAGSDQTNSSLQRQHDKDALNMALNALTVYHGSPHKFDKFDMSKIGTGEGAQSYGHGLYFAENPDIAKYYQEILKPVAAVSFNGKQIRLSKPATDRLSVSLQEIAKRIARGENPEDVLRNEISLWEESINRLKQFSKERGNDGHEIARANGIAKDEEHLSVLKEMSPGMFSYTPTESHLYKVDIPDEAVPQFLDWDKSLSQQAPEVQKVFGSVDPNGRINTGLAYERWRASQGISPVVAASQLKELGIPGIRYLDGGSRGAGSGTSNFVLFDDKMPRILEINGRPTGQLPWSKGEWKGLLSP